MVAVFLINSPKMPLNSCQKSMSACERGTRIVSYVGRLLSTLPAGPLFPPTLLPHWSLVCQLPSSILSLTADNSTKHAHAYEPDGVLSFLRCQKTKMLLEPTFRHGSPPPDKPTFRHGSPFQIIDHSSFTLLPFGPPSTNTNCVALAADAIGQLPVQQSMLLPVGLDADRRQIGMIIRHRLP